MPLAPGTIDHLSAQNREEARQHALMRRVGSVGTQRVRVLTANEQPIIYVSTNSNEFIDQIVCYLFGYQDEQKQKHQWEIVGSEIERDKHNVASAGART